jgi:hypothetical protein
MSSPTLACDTVEAVSGEVGLSVEHATAAYDKEITANELRRLGGAKRTARYAAVSKLFKSGLDTRRGMRIWVREKAETNVFCGLEKL